MISIYILKVTNNHFDMIEEIKEAEQVIQN